MSYISVRLQLNNSPTLLCGFRKALCAENGTHGFFARGDACKMRKGLLATHAAAPCATPPRRKSRRAVIDTAAQCARAPIAASGAVLKLRQFRALRVAQPVRRQGRHEK
jgi:hypothetical protein